MLIFYFGNGGHWGMQALPLVILLPVLMQTLFAVLVSGVHVHFH